MKESRLEKDARPTSYGSDPKQERESNRADSGGPPIRGLW